MKNLSKYEKTIYKPRWPYGQTPAQHGEVKFVQVTFNQSFSVLSFEVCF
jgi:hypothetical protein